jgi:hypothetical protein
MNDDPISYFPPAVDSGSLRERLTREFENYHRARQRQRNFFAAAAASASLAMLAWGLWPQGWQESPKMAVSPVSDSAAAEGISRDASPAMPSDGLDADGGEQTSIKSGSSIAVSDPSALDPSKYPHMRLKILGEEELVEELQRIESEKWFLVRINGEVTAFSKTEHRFRPPR